MEATGQPSGISPKPADVAVVIPAYNHAHFLSAAIESVLAQTRPVREIIVVDDASTDETSLVVARYPSVQLVRQPVNSGLSASRNIGARLASARYLLFLDADDRLLPDAVALSLACMARYPQAGFVYGAHRRIDGELRPSSGRLHRPLGPRPFHDFLRTNVVGMIATALFDRGKLLEAGGFDPELSRCEDYDLFLRLARRWPVGSHEKLVAEYRIHGENMSSDAATMLKMALAVLDRHRPRRTEREAWLAYRQGRRKWAFAYAYAVWQRRPGQPLSDLLSERLRMTRIAPGATALAGAAQLAKRLLPQSLATRLRSLLEIGRR